MQQLLLQGEKMSASAAADHSIASFLEFSDEGNYKSIIATKLACIMSFYQKSL